MIIIDPASPVLLDRRLEGKTGPEKWGRRRFVLTGEGRCPLPLTCGSDSVLPKTPIV